MPASIWLQLSGEADTLLRSVIAALAKRYGTMPFQPHLTVCGMPTDDDTVVDATAAFVKSCDVLPLRVAKSGLSYSTSAPFKAVVIDIENTEELHNFRDGLRRITGAPPFEPPHISLLYTIDAARNVVPWATDPARLREIAADAAQCVCESEFTLDAPVIVTTDGEWSNIVSWSVRRQL
jgi:hypothetical protein